MRVVVLGGSTAFGYRVRPDESFPAALERRLRSRREQAISIANLAYNSESAVCFAPTLDHYAYLEPDVVLFYSGYNDLPDRVYFR